MKNLLSLLVLLSLFFMTSCGEGEDQLIGKYVLTDIQFSGCLDPDEATFQFDNGGLCITEDGVYGCLFFCLTFSENSLMVDISATEDGNEIFSLSQSAAYDPESETIDFCLPDNTCDGITVSDDKKRIVFSGYDDDLECDFTFTMQKA